MPAVPKVVPANTPYTEDRGIWRIFVNGSVETGYHFHWSATLDTDNDLGITTVLRWIHSVCRKQFDAGTKLAISIRSKNTIYENDLIVIQ